MSLSVIGVYVCKNYDACASSVIKYVNKIGLKILRKGRIQIGS